MKSATVKELKDELATYSQKEILAICLRLSKFKKENKELLTYLLYESKNEMAYIQNVKNEIEIQFEQINKTSYYFIKKSVRKILRTIKKHIRYSQKKETEVELLIFFCYKLNNFHPSINKNKVLQKLYLQQIESVRKTVSKLHEDLQYDYEKELDELSQ
jgi:DNA repair protein RadC